jgi:large subunit ribosomal protein L10
LECEAVNRTEKQEEIQSLHKIWGSANNAYFFDYRGLKVEQVAELRRKVRATQSGYRVVKNRLAILASKETPLEAQHVLFDGMTAVVWNESDPVDLAKVLHEFARTSSLTIKGGVVEGRAVEPKEIEGITTLPARPDLIATFAGMIRSPLVKFVSVLNAPLRDFASVLKQVADKRQEKTQSG